MLHLIRICILGLLILPAQAQNIGIGTPTPHDNALLEIQSTDKGLLIPRLTQAEIEAMGAVPEGLMLYNTDSQCFQFYGATGWVRLCADADDCPPPPKPTASSNSPVQTGSPISLTTPEVAGAAYLWTGPNGFSASTREPSIAEATLADGGDYIVRLWRFGCYSEPDTIDVVVITPPRSCAEVLAANPSATDGEYEIDPDGAGPLDPFDCYCDMTTDGGGWTLVLNYLHEGGTNPALNVRTTNLPLLGSDVLGTDEAATAFWGHAAPALFNEIPKTEVRFWGRTGAHARVIHFRTDHANTLAYFNTGTGSMDGVQSSFTALAGHTANLPGAAVDWFTNQGDAAMTEFPFWLVGVNHWGIRGLGDRWEVDDFPNSDANNTHHQIWVR